MSSKQKSAPAPPSNAALIFPVIIGLFFFITIIKFGSPVIIQYTAVLDAPKDLTSAIFEIWPTNWAPWLFVPVALVGVFAIALDRVKLHWALALPLIWLVWEFISATQTVNPALTKITVTHFAVCVCLFYLGFFARAGMANPWPV